MAVFVNAAQKTGGKYFGGERNVVENRGRKPKKPEAETMKETMDDLNDLEDMMKSAKETQALNLPIRIQRKIPHLMVC